MRFENKVIVVTGATSGIGAVTAEMFAAEGATVILTGRNCERGEKIAKRIINAGNIAPDFIYCDVSELESVQNLHEIIAEKYGKVDVLFNNAGVYITSDLENLEFKDWDHTFRTNVNSVLYMTKSFMDLLISVHGNIINNASVSGLDWGILW